MAGNASWNGATNTFGANFQFPSGAVALRAIEGALSELGIDHSAMTNAQKATALRAQMGLWWKGLVRNHEMRRDRDAATVAAIAAVDAQIDLS